VPGGGARAPEGPALITLTTGSTGHPKAAPRSLAVLWAQHRALAAYRALDDDDVDLPALPVLVLSNLAQGIPSVLPDFDPRRPAEIDPAAIYRQILAEGVTTSSGSPAFYDRLAAWCERTGRRLPLRKVFTGGAPVLPPLARRLRAAVAGEVHAVYGSTEAEPIAGIEAAALLDAATGAAAEPGGVCVGPPVPEAAVRLVRPSDGPLAVDGGGWAALEVPEGEVGEVVVAGDHVLTGYLDHPEADRAHKIRDGERTWHRTGDAARMDADGRLWLMGRLSERVRRAGRVWWSLAAEMRALEVAGVSHAAYLGVPDPALGERAVICVETRASALGPAARDGLVAAVAPAPVDALRVLRHIRRDPRHASKTDTQALRAQLGNFPVRNAEWR
jgi:acyl-CoA synthetase (AMP-forming)/AMP-acid ligase II